MTKDLIFDADGSQYAGGGACTACGNQQGIESGFVRVRERHPGTGAPGVITSVQRAWLCPDCIGRALLVVMRHGWQRHMSPAVRGALRRAFDRNAGAAPPARRLRDAGARR